MTRAAQSCLRCFVRLVGVIVQAGPVVQFGVNTQAGLLRKPHCDHRTGPLLVRFYEMNWSSKYTNFAHVLLLLNVEVYNKLQLKTLNRAQVQREDNWTMQQYRQHHATVQTTPCNSTDNTMQQYRQHHATVQTTPCNSTNNTMQQYRQHHATVQTTPCNSTDNTMQQYRQHHATVQTTPCNSTDNTMQQYRQHHATVQQ